MIRSLLTIISVFISLVVWGQKRPEINTIFSVSPTSVHFNPEGGSKVFIIKSNKPWRISTNTSSWGRLVKSGNTLTLSVDKNTGQKSRSDYFELISNDKNIRVSISQEGEVFQSNEPNQVGINQAFSYDIACNRLLTENDVIGMSKKDLRIMRNWIYARHGRIFKKKDLQVYFSGFDWYKPRYVDIPYSSLSDIEQKNIDLIKRYE